MGTTAKATDKIVTGNEALTIQTSGGSNPWVQFEFECPVEVRKFLYASNPLHGHLFKNVAFHVGDEVAVIGQVLNSASICATFPGPVSTMRLYEIDCAQPKIGKYVTLQMPTGNLMINELLVFDTNILGKCL